MRTRFVFFILYFLSMLFYECKESDKLSETDEGKKIVKRHVPIENAHRRVMTNMEEILSHNWSQVIEGKEFVDILPLLKTDQELFCVLSAQKKENRSYEIAIHYYDGAPQINTICGTYHINIKGELIAENNGPELVIKKEDNHHITFNLNGSSLSFQGKPVRFFKTPDSIEDLYGTWRARSFIDRGERGDFVSADLAHWSIPRKGSDKYFQNRNARVRDRDYSLKIFEEPRRNPASESSGRAGFFIGSFGIGFTADQKPILSQGNNSFLVKKDDDSLKRIYILDYDSYNKTITTLIWWSYKDPYIKNRSRIIFFETLGLDEYIDKFTKVDWKKS